VCDDLNSILAANMSEKDLHYNVELNISNPIVVCDKMRLNQILLNCIGNAVKFTNPNGTIDFSITQKGWLSDDRAMYEFKVRDDGIGMSEDFSKHIFEPFERERTSTVSGIQGTGLGMAITKSIVDMMKGTITVESEIGKGTEFVISLPLKISSQELKAIEPLNDGKAETAPEGCKVLLVEDIEMNREIAKVVLEEAGFEVDMARNGKEAVDKVSDAAPDRYDVILMDIQMPVMDGYQACTKIRQMDGKKAEIPIVAMTANAFEEDRQRASGVGMDGYLTKPLKADELCKTIISILKS
jgi:CheY-like chemotaxis protein